MLEDRRVLGRHERERLLAAATDEDVIVERRRVVPELGPARAVLAAAVARDDARRATQKFADVIIVAAKFSSTRSLKRIGGGTEYMTGNDREYAKSSGALVLRR